MQALLNMLIVTMALQEVQQTSKARLNKKQNNSCQNNLILILLVMQDQVFVRELLFLAHLSIFWIPWNFLSTFRASLCFPRGFQDCFDLSQDKFEVLYSCFYATATMLMHCTMAEKFLDLVSSDFSLLCDQLCFLLLLVLF